MTVKQQGTQGSALGRFWKRISGPYMIAVVMTLALIIWVASGQVGNSSEPEEAQTSSEVKLPQVQVEQLFATQMTRELVLQGRTEPAREATVAAETEGRIVATVAARGDVLRTGDVIARIETGEREARLQQAQAWVKQREIDYQGALTLQDKGYRAETQTATAMAELESARVQLEQARLDLERTVIRAPFDGVLEERFVEVGDFAKRGNALALVIESDPFIVVADVSETEVVGLSAGQPGVASLVDGRELQGSLRYVAAKADAATRTYRVELEVSNTDQRIAVGMTAKLVLPRDEVWAHKISPALLTLDEAGTLGVKVLNDRDEVVFQPADILRSEVDGVWVAGLQQTTRLITVGQGFVRPGDQVQPVPAGDAQISVAEAQP